MIDIHSHILPGIDDGAQSEADSLAMGRAAVAEGIHTIIATPHHKNGAFTNSGESIVTYTDILNTLFKEQGIDLTLLAGQETRIHGDMVADLARGDIIPLNHTKYVFVELPTSDIPRYTSQLLFDMQVAGYIPIIVHPERNEKVIENPNVLYDFVQKGALTQITAGSVIGKFGRTVQKVTQQLIEANLTHFIASDAHNITTRTFWMDEAYEQVNETYGFDTHYFFLENSQLLIDGMNVNKEEPQQIRKKKFFGLF